ncbi:MAG: HAD-IA family hydrolase [Armatimonadetes bacterium]|nr:HAD-IA family hydrolase [Armatimonadota bacterium]NIM23601.1 HAD-IA family hydrolase [Armatimonadota bacterium]NIM67467.1 HAD-IA family hydrolase [Armatimonadota bacterium]NIM75964.1 HAD-IA family hydrolase [Armatimonadota bacterium]NIN05653.1 HAD-IA family hydrolase [Armatimonadota bacterium]
MDSLPRLRAVIFDLDGTLVNCPYDFTAMRQAVIEIGRRFGIAEEELAGLGVLEAIEAGEKLLGPTTGKRFREEAEERVLALELAGAADSAPLPGVRETLAWLCQEGLRVGIITRNSAKVVGNLLRRAELQYDALLTREAVARVKPHPGHLQTMLARLECSSNEAVMVGDHIWDMTCGKEAGLICVGMATGAASKEALYEAGAEEVLEDMGHLPEWLKERFCLSGGKFS